MSVARRNAGSSGWQNRCISVWQRLWAMLYGHNVAAAMRSVKGGCRKPGWGTCFEPCSFANPACHSAYCSAGRGFHTLRLWTRGTARAPAGTGGGASRDVAAAVSLTLHAGARLAARHRDAENGFDAHGNPVAAAGQKPPLHPRSAACSSFIVIAGAAHATEQCAADPGSFQILSTMILISGPLGAQSCTASGNVCSTMTRKML